MPAFARFYFSLIYTYLTPLIDYSFGRRFLINLNMFYFDFRVFAGCRLKLYKTQEIFLIAKELKKLLHLMKILSYFFQRFKMAGSSFQDFSRRRF